MNNYTVEMTFLVSCPVAQFFPPALPALYEPSAPIPGGRGLEDKHSAGSDNMINTTLGILSGK